MDVWRRCAGPRAPLSPAGTRGDKLLSLHLGWSSTYSTISAAIPANGCVTLFQIDQLQCVGHGLGHLLNQLWAITFRAGTLWTSPVIGCQGPIEAVSSESQTSKKQLSQTLISAAAELSAARRAERYFVISLYQVVKVP